MSPVTAVVLLAATVFAAAVAGRCAQRGHGAWAGLNIGVAVVNLTLFVVLAVGVTLP